MFLLTTKNRREVNDRQRNGVDADTMVDCSNVNQQQCDHNNGRGHESMVESAEPCRRGIVRGWVEDRKRGGLDRENVNAKRHGSILVVDDEAHVIG